MDRDGRYYYGLGVEAFEKDNILMALDYFKESINIDPHFKTYERMYMCYKKLNKITEARQCIEEAFRLNKNNDKVATEYIQFLITDNQITLAKDLLNDIIGRNASYGPANKLLKSIEALENSKHTYIDKD